MRFYLKLIIHAIYWTVYGSFSLAVSMAQQGEEWPLLSNITPHYFINFIWAVVAFYLFYFYFISFFENRKFGLYLTFSFLMSAILTLVFMPVHKIFFSGFDLLNYHIIGPPVIGTFIIFQTGILVRGFENWFSSIQLKAELENQKLKNELDLLKSQVNPHFLFNTLNNIDSLITKEPAKASKAIITLSEIMRYMLYETTDPKVPLLSEISHIRNIISLQSLRFRQPDYVLFLLNGSPENHQIAPLLFIPFIENAFKYAHYSGELPVVTIRFDIAEKEILFTCINYFDSAKKEVMSTGGIGLPNLRKQLSLLYPGKHELKVENKNAKFEAILRIDITHK